MITNTKSALLVLSLTSLLALGCQEQRLPENSTLQETETTAEAQFKNYAPLDTAFMESGGRFSGKAPLGYFSEAAKEHQYRLLTCDGDGSGGIAVDLSANPKAQSLYREANLKGKTVWLVVEGDVVDMPPNKDQWNRRATPAASLTGASILGMYAAESHTFPHFDEEK